MRKLAALTILTVLLVSLAGSASIGRAATHARASKKLSVLLYISGALGDLGFFDSANAGVARAQKELGVSTKVVQQADNTQWQTQILALAGSGRYDLIILDASDPAMLTATQALIHRYPHQRIIDFDDNYFSTKPHYSASVSSIIYKQNEGSFLAGALAAMVTDSNLPYVSHKKIIGMVGGMNIPVIVDFYDGYAQGAASVDPKIQVRVTYIGGSGSNDTWNNKPKGAQLARALYNDGAAVVYQVAGGSGLGVLAQAQQQGRYAIGVDSNQDQIAKGHVIGSVVKRVDNSLFDLIKLDMNNQLKGGYVYFYGLTNHGVDLTRDAETRKIISPAMYKKLDQLEAQVASGKIKVKSEFH